MTAFLSEIRDSFLPSRDGADGPLPPMLVSLTFLTGLVDAFSYLVLGHVFVANMTGNVVLLGFALVGARGFSIGSSVVAVAAFVVGSATGGRIGAKFAARRGHHLASAASVQVIFLAAGLILAALSTTPLPGGYRYGLIVTLALGMGIQNATARKLAVADLTTSVLTMTITGMAADSALGANKGAKAGRRLVAVGTMLAGAVVGGECVVHGHDVYPLVVAMVVALAVAVSAHVLSGSGPSWETPKG
jgi:uncharacterized membrane protein YoaK (UPF0700 family)